MERREESGAGQHVVAFKRTRDPQCFEPIFDMFRGRIYAICYAMVRDRATAEDLVQETFVRAFQGIDRFDETNPESCFEAWLSTISRNLCLSELRKLAVKRRALLIQPAQNPYHRASALVTVQLEEALSSLPEKARRCWLLFRLDGYRYKEIARLTGYTLQQVKHCLETAREKLEKKSR